MAVGMVVDASVFVSYLVPEDVHQRQSRAWLRQQLLDGTPLISPIFLLAEVGGALSRRTGKPELGRRAVAQLQQLPALRIVTVDERLGLRAAQLAADLRLRGADATYVAVAAELQLPLITWDQEQQDRARPEVQASSPQDFS